MDGRYLGTVVWFSEVKGYGFIQIDSGPHVFVHYSAIRPHGEARRNLLPDQRVQVCVTEGPKGLLATEVEVTV